MAGIFVSIEGIDAAGKNTQSKKLAERLKAQLFSFPVYTTPVGELIKGHLTMNWTSIFAGALEKGRSGDALVFQSLMILNRYETAPEIIAARASGRSVVCDRYHESSVVYGFVDGISKEYTHKLGAHLPKPDVRLLLDIPVEEMLNRRPQGRDRHESNLDFIQKVAAAYRQEWEEQRKQNPVTWQIINGVGTIEEVHERVCEAIAKVREA